MWRTKPAPLGPAAVCIYRLDALEEDSPLLSGRGGEVSNLKGLKRFPRRVARRIVGPRTPIDRRLFLAPVALDPLSPLLELPSPVPAVTYCELLRELCRSPAEKGRPFRREKFRAT